MEPSVLTLAAAPVGGVSVETGDAALAVSAGRQVLALLAHALVDTLAVAVTLTGCQRGSGAKVSENSPTATGSTFTTRLRASDLGTG